MSVGDYRFLSRINEDDGGDYTNKEGVGYYGFHVIGEFRVVLGV